LKKGEKFVSVEEFLPLVAELKKTKDRGSYEVFVECLRLYDRHENGTLMLGDLENLLLNLGTFYYIFFLIGQNIK
jgi:myosin light chain 6